MRKELKAIEVIEKYLTNQLSVKDKVVFEKALETNLTLKDQVVAQREIMEATKRVGLKKSTQKSHKKWKAKKLITRGALALVITTAIVALGMYVLSSVSPQIEVTPSYNSEFTTKDSISNFSNSQLEKEVFTISINQDTIIETKDGVVFYIPENSFSTESETVDLVVQTAINSEDIIMGGLSTTSNGDALETGGMFYVDAFVDGKRVSLNKELTVDVPTDKKKANMQLYKGEKTNKGEINWVAPKQLETFLTPVDILTLDFYPPNYEDSLDSWNKYDKAFKDSLYYSFAFEEGGFEISRFKTGTAISNNHGDTISVDEYWVSDSIAIEEWPNFPIVRPSTIKTIWNREFNNTILATKEFEERIPFIHNSCSNEVLETYINNLEKSLSEIDRMVLPLLSGAVKEQFIEFSQRGDGKVELTSKAASRLAGYYARKQKMIAKALAKTQNDYWNKQNKLDAKLTDKENESIIRDIQNTGDIFVKELKKNLCKVYEEVNYPYDCERVIRPIKAKYTVKIDNLGWNNIDRKVFESTLSRTTATINYNGKSSTLTYNEWSASIKEESQFDRVFVYNIPVEFNSYIKLSKKEDKYSYKLNADINYNTVVIGWAEDKTFYAKENSTKGYSTFSLQEIDKQKLKQLLKKELGNNAKSKAEADFMDYAQKDQKRLNKNQNSEELKSRIEPIIFPCREVETVPTDSPAIVSGKPWN
jgi:hypothetical protein